MSVTMEKVLHLRENDTVIIAQSGEPIVNITARDARRKVNAYVGGEISLMMHGIDPALVYSEGRLVWRVRLNLQRLCRVILVLSAHLM